MRRREAWRRVMAALLLATAAQAAEVPAFRHGAPIVVEQAAPFVQLPLDAGVYARSAQAALQDLRVVDARGERVPFALLAPRADRSDGIEEQRTATLYALPRRPDDGSAWPLPVEVLVQGDAIRVVQRAGSAASREAAAAGATPPGWLVDTGERRKDEPSPARRTLLLQWSGPAEFSVGVALDASDDLRNWRRIGGGQLLSLNAATGPLTQPRLPLPADAPRFLRLAWLDAAAAPRLSAATLLLERRQPVVLDAPTALAFAPSSEPAGRNGLDALAARSLHVDLGGPLPLASVDLGLAAGNAVVPLRVQGRLRLDEPWRELAQAVVYRLDRGGTASASPPVELQATARYLRIVPDERAAPLDAAGTRVLVQARLARLVFATQGQPPYALLAGDAAAAPGALPAGTLVPALDEERARFGRATLGAWREVEAVARRDAAAARMAALRPYALWGVLLAGVAGLGLMVWRLARPRAG